jgi:hypothetical protein
VEVLEVSIQIKVSYVWSGTRGFLALVSGTNQLAANYPDILDFSQPAELPMPPVYPNDRPLMAQLGITKNK